MRVALSADMEGIAGMRSARELFACCPDSMGAGPAPFMATWPPWTSARAKR